MTIGKSPVWSDETPAGMSVQAKWLQATALNLCSINTSWIMIDNSPMSLQLPLKFICVCQAPVVHRHFADPLLRFTNVLP
ncbi:hypothetical protein HAX54_038009, partial [Datura stramonium]|nr:hypothetical protein [Datura stramonium]